MSSLDQEFWIDSHTHLHMKDPSSCRPTTFIPQLVLSVQKGMPMACDARIGSDRVLSPRDPLLLAGDQSNEHARTIPFRAKTTQTRQTRRVCFECRSEVATNAPAFAQVLDDCRTFCSTQRQLDLCGSQKCKVMKAAPSCRYATDWCSSPPC